MIPVPAETSKCAVKLMMRHRAQVLIPTGQFIRSLVAARLAADVCGVPTVLIARTDAHSANLLTADVDERDLPFVHGERTPEGFHQFNGGIKVRGVILVVGVYRMGGAADHWWSNVACNMVLVCATACWTGIVCSMHGYLIRMCA